MNTDIKKNKRFEKDFVKSMNNSFFGKTMENVTKNIETSNLQQWKKEGNV